MSFDEKVLDLLRHQQATHHNDLQVRRDVEIDVTVLLREGLKSGPLPQFLGWDIKCLGERSVLDPVPCTFELRIRDHELDAAGHQELVLGALHDAGCLEETRRSEAWGRPVSDPVGTPTSKLMLSTWFDQGVDQGATHMLVICDTYDYTDYPVYCKPGEDPRVLYEYQWNRSMQKVMEVYDLGLPRDPQLDERRAMHLPELPTKPPTSWDKVDDPKLGDDP